jgi:hypothetical protein
VTSPPPAAEESACLLELHQISGLLAVKFDAVRRRWDLGTTLPVEASGTNVEATKEVGEPAPADLGFAVTGHSVWFEWEATDSGFVTVSACGGGLRRPVLGVYTGTAVDALTERAGDFASQGPDCPSFGDAVTFRAIAGVSYKVVVEGTPFFPEEELPGQGAIALRLAQTPAPANDDFADAAVLNGQTLENGICAAPATGFTWNATKEPGEPAHAGDPGGASVWYSWTAPSSADYTVTACGRFLTSLLGVYTGNSVDGLTEVASDHRSCSLLTFSASLGTRYFIAVDGAFDSASGAAAMGSISLNLYEEPAKPPTLAPTTSVPALTPLLEVAKPPANTLLRKRTLRPARAIARFHFGSSQRGSTFLCRLDRRPFSTCTSPREYRGLQPGRHVFEVAAASAYGRDPTPAVALFMLGKPKPDPGAS